MEPDLRRLPRQVIACATLSICLFFVLALPLGWSATVSLTLERAHELAERDNPDLRQARSEIVATVGERQDAQAFLYNNPTLNTGFLRRRVESVSGKEWVIGIEQPFELAGQRRMRRAATDSELASVRSSVESLRRRLYAEVENRFLRVLSVQSRLSFEQEALALVERSASIVSSRVGAGEDTRLEGNLAEVEVGRMRNQLDRSREELISSQSELAALLQLSPGTFPEAAGTLDATPVRYGLHELIESGEHRPALTALEHREGAQRSRLELERAARYPDLTVGLIASREQIGRIEDTATALTLSLPLPLFNRNATGIGRAYADLSRTRIEREAAKRDIRADIEALWERLLNLWARLQRMNDDVLPRLDENMRLAQVSYRSGEISISELLLSTRQVVDARRDILDATVEYETTRVLLEEAAGWRPQAAEIR